MFSAVLDNSAIFGFPEPSFHYAAVHQLFFMAKMESMDGQNRARI